jgi:hypothetical protein
MGISQLLKVSSELLPKPALDVRQYRTNKAVVVTKKPLFLSRVANTLAEFSQLLTRAQGCREVGSQTSVSRAWVLLSLRLRCWNQVERYQ